MVRGLWGNQSQETSHCTKLLTVITIITNAINSLKQNTFKKTSKTVIHHNNQREVVISFHEAKCYIIIQKSTEGKRGQWGYPHCKRDTNNNGETKATEEQTSSSPIRLWKCWVSFSFHNTSIIAKKLFVTKKGKKIKQTHHVRMILYIGNIKRTKTRITVRTLYCNITTTQKTNPNI